MLSSRMQPGRFKLTISMAFCLAHAHPWIRSEDKKKQVVLR